MAGRPRKTFDKKVLAGTNRADRDGTAEEQVNAGGVPAQPADMSEAARVYWSAIVPGLVASGVAKACDSEALGLMCWWLVQLHEFRRDVDAIRAANEQPSAQLFVQAGIATDKFSQIAARFGLTPSDRAKLRIDPPKRDGGVRPRKR